MKYYTYLFVCGFTTFHDLNMQNQFQLWFNYTPCKQMVLY